MFGRARLARSCDVVLPSRLFSPGTCDTNNISTVDPEQTWHHLRDPFHQGHVTKYKKSRYSQMLPTPFHKGKSIVGKFCDMFRRARLGPSCDPILPSRPFSLGTRNKTLILTVDPEQTWHHLRDPVRQGHVTEYTCYKYS